jgi:hypothetical protein
LKSIRESIGREMRWRRTRFLPPAFEMRVGDETAATLEWPKILSRSALAAAAEGRWRFRRGSAFSWTVTIEDAESGTQLGSYSPGPLRGLLRLEDGRAFRIGRDSLFGRLKVGRENAGELLSFSRRPAFGGGASLRVEASASGERDLGLLVTFAFFLLTLRRRRAAAASAG